MLDTDVLSFSGAAGQLFSIADTMTGTIFSVNDVSGMPSIEVFDTGKIQLAELSGNVLIGSSTDNGTDKLQVTGSARISTALGVVGPIKQSQISVNGNSATTTLDFSLSGNFYITLSSSTTLAFSNLSSNIGSSGYIFLKQNGTGGYTVGFPAQAKTPGGRTFTQVTAANSLSLITFYVVDANTVIVNYIADFK
jgi:hypothetical protein